LEQEDLTSYKLTGLLFTSSEQQDIPTIPDHLISTLILWKFMLLFALSLWCDYFVSWSWVQLSIYDVQWQGFIAHLAEG